MTLVTDPGTDFTSFPAQTVEVIDYLSHAGGWVAVPYLWCWKLQRAANAYDRAELRYEIGQGVMQPGATTFADWQPLSIRGKFIRITFTDATNGDYVWIGYIPIDVIQRDGVVTISGVNKFKGESQEFIAVGLEYFLDRRQVDSALIHDVNRITRALVFNGGPNHDLDPLAGPRGNRHPTTNADSLYSFATDPTAGVLWTAEQIVQNLLKYHVLSNSVGGVAPCDFSLDSGDVVEGILEGITPTVPTERQTVFKLLNAICTPQRGLCWWAETFWNSVSDFGCRIRVATSATEDITLPGGATFPENANQQALDFDSERDVARCDIKTTGSRMYHKVIVRGERQTTTLTLGIEQETLEQAWTDEMEIEFQAGASADGDYGGLTTPQKKDRNDAMRQADRYMHVYSAFRIPPDWDGRCGDGGTSAQDYAFPILNDAGSPGGSLHINTAGMRMLNKTRLKQGWDYTDPSSPVSKTPAGDLVEFMPPLAVMKVATSPDKWQLVDKMDKSNYHVGTRVSPNIQTTYHLRMMQTVPGIRIDAAGGMNQACALNHWAGAEPTDHMPEVDFETLRATVCIEADAYAEGIYFPTPPTNKPLEVLVIDVGEHYRLDWIAANTIVEVKNGDLVLTSSDAVLRDDRSTLRDLARIAYEWYSLDRVAMEVEFRQVRNLFDLGMLITTIGVGTTQTTCNTLVSNIVYDFKNGTMTIATADDTLDVRSLAGGKRRA